jgi:large subunit ribosomal protein L28
MAVRLDSNAHFRALTAAPIATIRQPSDFYRPLGLGATGHPPISCGHDKDKTMSRVCELTGKGGQTGHRVSHSNMKTKHRFLPNLNNVTLLSDQLQRSFRLRISANALRTVEHRGGLDAFLMKESDDNLSRDALAIKRELEKKSEPVAA